MRRYTELLLRFRLPVMVLTAIVTALMGLGIGQLRVVIDPNKVMPQNHPYVATGNRVESIFGSRWVVVIGVTPRSGDAYQPAVLAKVKRITDALADLPSVVKSSVTSISAGRVKNIVGTAEGMEVHPLMEEVPKDAQGLQALRQAVRSNQMFENSIISKDERTLAIVAEFKAPKAFSDVQTAVESVVAPERDEAVEINFGGGPIFLAMMEKFSQRMAFFFPLAVLLIGLIHFEAFRTFQGLILPLVTALLSVVWAVGMMGLVGIPMDSFNATTPILILAIAAGHAVQILKRYYEEYHRIRTTKPDLPLKQANVQAVVDSMGHVGPVMLNAGIIASLGFFSLVVFDITTIRTFGVFTAMGILSALLLELTFIPALRSVLPAPKAREAAKEREHTVWDRLIEGLAGLVGTGTGRKRIFVGAVLILVTAGVGISRISHVESLKSFFFPSVPQRHQDDVLNDRLGGTNALYVLIEGQGVDAIKDPSVLHAMDETQAFLAKQAVVGKTLSVADYLKQMNRAMHGNSPGEQRIPDSQRLIAQYLLLYSQSGQPDDFDAYVDNDYKSAVIWVFSKSDKTNDTEALIHSLQDFTSSRFPKTVKVSVGGDAADAVALSDEMVRTKLLNILQIALVIFLISALAFRSILGGLFVLVPLTLTVVMNFGLMGLTGIGLNVTTSVISPMAVGIGADYAIYFLFRLREELSKETDVALAFRNTFSSAGKAILFVASAVTGGYGILVFSWGFKIHMLMALLIGTAMVFSSFATLTVLPSLLLALRPRFLFTSGSGRSTGAARAAALVVLGTLALLAPSRAWAEGVDAADLMRKSALATKLTNAVLASAVTLVNKSGESRVRKIVARSKIVPGGTDEKVLMQFRSPPDIAGTSILMLQHSGGDDDIWIYLPDLKKVRRLVASNKKDSFVGTDFSYGDIIGYKIDEWSHRLVGEEVLDGQPVYVIESVARDAAVRGSSGYSKRISRLRKDNLVMVKADLFNSRGTLFKTIRWSDYRQVDPAASKFWAMRWEVANTEINHKTVIQYDSVKVNQPIDDAMFTPQRLER